MQNAEKVFCILMCYTSNASRLFGNPHVVSGKDKGKHKSYYSNLTCTEIDVNVVFFLMWH